MEAMNIIDFLKKQKRWTVSKYNLWKAYHSDYKEYEHWQYHNPDVKTQNALEAKILRQTHVIEKGMSLTHPREKFGVQKSLELLDFIDEFVECGYKIEDSTPVSAQSGCAGCRARQDLCVSHRKCREHRRLLQSQLRLAGRDRG